jgi:hypothetical protein
MILILILLIKLVACRANIKEMIDSYLDKMTVRAGYSVNFAFDKALTRTGHAPDWEIYQLKRDVISQAQAMFRPLAKSVLIDSFRPSRLQKRAGPSMNWFYGSGFHEHFTSSSSDSWRDFSRDDPDFKDPNSKIETSYSPFSNDEKQERSSLFDDPEELGKTNRLHSPLNDPPSHHIDPESIQPLSESKKSLDADHFDHQKASSKKTFAEKMQYDPRNYRREWWGHSDKYSTEWYHTLYEEEISKGGKSAAVNGLFPPEKSWNMRIAGKVREIINRFLEAWKSVVIKLNLGKFSDSLDDRFSVIFKEEIAHRAGLVVIGMGIGYLAYALLFKKESADDHEYFE